MRFPLNCVATSCQDSRSGPVEVALGGVRQRDGPRLLLPRQLVPRAPRERHLRNASRTRCNLVHNQSPRKCITYYNVYYIMYYKAYLCFSCKINSVFYFIWEDLCSTLQNNWFRQRFFARHFELVLDRPALFFSAACGHATACRQTRRRSTCT